MAKAPTQAESDTETFVSWREFLGSSYAPSLALASVAVWLIAVFAAMEGGGFGMAWTFVLRRATALADANEVERVSGAIPTVHRLGYALGAAYIGVVANASGLTTMTTSAAAAHVAHWTFMACLPFAVLALIAMAALATAPAAAPPADV